MPMGNYLPIRINMSEYIWTAPGTDITMRWRLNGYIPPSELQEYKDKWRYYQNLPLRNLDDRAKEAYEAVLRKAKVVRIK
jgi:hypothetical protein